MNNIKTQHPHTLRTALIQMTSQSEIADNIPIITDLVTRAAQDGGARLIITPENTCHIRGKMVEKQITAPNESDHPLLTQASTLARDLSIYLILGSVSIQGPHNKLLNRTYVYNPDGTIQATYDKIHLFDAELRGGQTFRESDVFAYGDRAVITDIDGFKIGLTICYDLRFPHLYRTLAHAGAEAIIAPAAYAVGTGPMHWNALIHARAIENSVYMLAPAQVGCHAGGRRTYGHSMIVGPWGDTIAELETNNPGILYTTLNHRVVEDVRNQVHSLHHDRPFSVVMS